ncbi:MAG TPA: hypothetical protein VHQ87_03250 [Rhizobacter sp.]|jgi:hypothetical protein|nr:hypothetical protein [Rhizobacter sp.]
MGTTPSSALRRAALTAALASVLSACGNADDDTPAPATSAVPSVAEGALQASVEGDSASVGTALFNADGRGYVILSSDGDSGATVVHVADQHRSWARRVPATSSFVTLRFARSEPLSLTPLTGAALAGSYQLMLDGKPAALAITTDGGISAAAGSSCKLTGQVDLASNYGGARGLTLKLEACGQLAAGTYQGVLYASGATAPAAWQAVLENGSSVLDLLAYR